AAPRVLDDEVAAASDVDGCAAGFGHRGVVDEPDDLYRVTAVAARHLVAHRVETRLGVVADYPRRVDVIHEALVDGERGHEDVTLREQHAVAVQVERLAVGPQLVGVVGTDARTAEGDRGVAADGEDESGAHSPALVSRVRAGARVGTDAIGVAGVGVGRGVAGQAAVAVGGRVVGPGAFGRQLLAFA